MRDALGAVQSALVLGGGSDIARATVRRLLTDGGSRLGTVVLAARHAESRLDALAGELRAIRPGLVVELVEFDADDVESHAALFDEVAARHGDIDLVLVAFGVLGDPAVTREQTGEALAVLHTNVLGSASVLMLAAQLLAGQGHGDIVWLSSVAGQRVRRSNFPYGASKAGGDGFAEGLADHLHGTGVHVMVVRPGFVRTKMTAGLPDQPMTTTPDAVADAIVHGLRTRADTVWVPPALRWVFAGLKLLPRPVWRRIDR
ncbi:MAG: hypothetical protein JWO37_2400 [Acidimicrobiales bacterium]|nr:hypothetical protein [Acidimicrobiales bacterium]